MIDTENKLEWCKAGADAEEEFVMHRMRKLGLHGCINPKKAKDKYTHDLLVTMKADLKTVRTPVYKAYDMHQIDPQFAVTFNLKDEKRYLDLYPNIIVFFDVMWGGDALRWKDKFGDEYSVEPMHRTFGGDLTSIRKAIEACGSQKIEYQRRVNDTSGNAKASWVFDVRLLHEYKELP